MTMFFMLIFLCIYSFMIFYKTKIYNNDNILSNEDSINLKGIWSIIIILVHTPVLYQNRIQDMLGSFAYIGVTFFFLTSSYGLLYSLETKKNYFKDFWKKRLVKLLLPCFIINILNVILEYIFYKKTHLLNIFDINRWVVLLIICYFIFYITYILFNKDSKKMFIANILIILGMSMVTYFTKYKIAFLWPTEVLGFIYGIILFYVIKKDNKNNKLFNILTIILFGLVSLLLGLAYLKFKHLYFFGEYLLKVILGLFLNLFVISITKKIKIGNIFTRFLGKISYEIYLIHGIVFIYLSKLNIINNSGVFIFTSVILTILLSIIIKNICDFTSKFMIKEEK